MPENYIVGMVTNMMKKIHTIGQTAAESAEPVRAKEQESVGGKSIGQPKSCSGCPLYGVGEGFALGEGPNSAKIAIIGEALGQEEAQQGRPFVGGAGRILNALLAQAGIKRGSIFVDNVLRCRPPNNKYPTGRVRAMAERHCRQYDRIAVDIVPNVVILAGDKALKLHAKRSGITKWRGSVLWRELDGDSSKPSLPRAKGGRKR